MNHILRTIAQFILDRTEEDNVRVSVQRFVYVPYRWQRVRVGQYLLWRCQSKRGGAVDVRVKFLASNETHAQIRAPRTDGGYDILAVPLSDLHAAED